MWCLLCLVASVRAARYSEGFQSTHSTEMISSYEDFRSKYRQSQDGADTVDYATRLALFEARRAAAEAHNSQGRTWKAGINQFADYTTEEFASLLGYKRHARSKGWQSWQDASFLQVQEHGNGKVIAEAVDWLQNVTVSRNYTHDQGPCGSCWAAAAALTLEMHTEIANLDTVPLSFEQLVDCVANPEHCGGDGGCKGATAELAFDHVKKSGGIVAADTYKGGYLHSNEGKCKPPTPDVPIVRIADFKRLEINRLQPLLETVATTGPVVASVDATGWGSYWNGVFDGCPRDATVNHAVTLIGYGHDSEHKKDYWLIRNSWGTGWGEDGTIRLLRHSSDRGEAGYCGTDRKPEEGNGCRGGPKEIEVCGMCGVLSDSVYPIGVTLSKASEAQQTVQPHH
eukprot:TRINITY_DN9829_c0_g1_i1.p1 TRINITY_DN9829_c0_g1~~TRINITY_DN9829_c0_g1_i1.p1  ORF type:complete len:398 (-),score=64.13 TRINITY_DN9829_c0_g1_i1:19-1212(-)